MSHSPDSSAAPSYRIGSGSLDRETPPVRLTVRGDLPDWLSGSLVRTGPAKFEVGQQSYAHWFDGLAMLHSFAIDRGLVTYTNRFLRSHSFCEAEDQDRIVVT